MPVFHLDIREGTELIEDEDGQDLSDLAAARAEAVVGARDILAWCLRRGEPLGSSSIEIRDEAGSLLETVEFSDTFSVCKGGADPGK